jgi:hypothetical protein
MYHCGFLPWHLVGVFMVSPYALKTTYDTRPCWIEALGALSGVTHLV